MFAKIRRYLVPSLSILTVAGSLVALPGVAQAQEPRRAPVVSSHAADREHDRFERERFERERIERERIERERHRDMCVSAYEHGASWWHLRELGCR
jgi:hypothetical protein